MRYNKVKHDITTTINGQDYSFRYTVNGFIELEAVSGKGIMDIFSDTQNGKIPSLAFLVDAVRIGLSGEGVMMPKNEVAALVMTLARAKGFSEVVNLFFGTIAASGLLGLDASEEMLQNLGMVSAESHTKEKNGTAAVQNRR